VQQWSRPAPGRATELCSLTALEIETIITIIQYESINF